MFNKKAKYIIYFLITSVSIGLLINSFLSNKTDESILKGRILKINSEKITRFENRLYTQQNLSIKIDEYKTVNLNSELLPNNYKIRYVENDRVLVGKTGSSDNLSYYLIGLDRTNIILILTVVFILLILAVARKKGLASLIAFIYSITIIVTIILPLFISKFNPLVVSFICIVLILPISFFITHGINYKSISALIGSSITIIIVSIFSYSVVRYARITGFTSSEMEVLLYSGDGQYNPGLIILSGLIISTLGILDDITITQASIVKELSDQDKTVSIKKLFKKAMRVGSDHIGSIINTLALVYLGSSMIGILILATYTRPLSVILNNESILIQIIVVLIGSIGLILSVPITTLIACRLSRLKIKSINKKLK